MQPGIFPVRNKPLPVGPQHLGLFGYGQVRRVGDVPVCFNHQFMLPIPGGTDIGPYSRELVGHHAQLPAGAVRCAVGIPQGVHLVRRVVLHPYAQRAVRSRENLFAAMVDFQVL